MKNTIFLVSTELTFTKVFLCLFLSVLSFTLPVNQLTTLLCDPKGKDQHPIRFQAGDVIPERDVNSVSFSHSFFRCYVFIQTEVENTC